MLRATRRSDDEQGFVLVFFSIMLILLLSLAGFIVDFGNWQLQGAKIQRTADAAALAGAVFLPDNPDQAIATAIETAARNGYTSGVDAHVVPGHVDQLEVTMTETVRNYFAQVVGMSTKDITQSAVATFQKPIAMGSPTNQFGNDPDSCAGQHGTACYPDFWANVAGKASTKISGDRYTAGACAGGPDRCPSDYATSANGGDYDSFGHVFAVEVKQAGTLTVQVFDPAFVHVGDHCDQANAGLSGIASVAPTYGLSASRYATGDTSPYCTGDNYFASSPGSEPTTTYTMRSPGPLPADPVSSPILGSCSASKFDGVPVTDDLKADFQQDNHHAAGFASASGFRDYFRRWVTVCQVNASPGTYFLQVQGPSGNGHNRYAVRATVNGSSSGVAVYGYQHMAIYANAPQANTTFYLARVPSSAANHTLVVDLYDIGDAPNGSTGTLTILPPTEWNGSFTTCTFRKGISGTAAAAPGCAIGGVSSSNGFNGKIDEFQVAIPSTYTCSDSLSSGCWVRINLAFTGNVEDTTTWSAFLDGDPVRIVK